MKTPYDAALRVADRELDDARTAIGVALAEVQRIEDDTATLAATMTREAAAVAGDRSLAADRFFTRARKQRMALAAAQNEAQARLEMLRARAIECYGTRTAIDGAAMQYRHDAERIAAAAEQAALDDVAASRLVRARRRRPSTLQVLA